MSQRDAPLTLAFRPSDDGSEYRRDLSTVVQVGGDLWLASDEHAGLERLSAEGELRYGRHASFRVAEYVDLPDGDEEIDVEGIDCAGDVLWIVGSHSVRRRKPDDDASPKKQHRQLARITRGGNRYLLACVPLVRSADGERMEPAREDGERRAARLSGGRRRNQLTDAIRKDEHLAPFLDIPGKENGFDVEGLAVAGERVFLGLRGPVLRGWAVVLGVAPEPSAKKPGRLRLRRVGRGGRRYDKHLLDLRGMGVRELCVDGDDLLVLAGPSMALDGRAAVFRWRGGAHATGDSVVSRDEMEKLFDVPYGEGDDEDVDHPEGIAVVRDLDGRRAVLIVYDAPTRRRQRGDAAVEADLFALR